LAIQAGLDSFYWAYLEAIGEPLDHYPFYLSAFRLNKSDIHMTPIYDLVFDLDDTLYNESTYVLSGMKSVAKFLSKLACISGRNNL